MRRKRIKQLEHELAEMEELNESLDAHIEILESFIEDNAKEAARLVSVAKRLREME